MRAYIRGLSLPTAMLLICACLAGFHGRTAEHCASCAAAAQRYTSAAADHFRKGLELAKQGRFAEAEAEYREAVRLDPNNPDYRAMLGDALAAQGKSAAADAQYQQEQKLNQMKAKLAASKPSRGRKNSSSAAAAKPPHSGQTPTAAAGTHLPGKTASSSETHSDPAKSPPGNSGKTPFPSSSSGGEIVITERNGTTVTTTRRDGRTIITHPGPGGATPSSGADSYSRAVALLDQGDAFAEKGNWAEAESLYRKAAVVKPRMADCWDSLGKACAAQKKWAEAVTAYRHAVDLTDEAPFHASLAEALLRTGKRDEAIKEAKKAIEKGLPNLPIYKELGLP